jgi:polyisoprenoid-binding protein YceI
MKSFTLLAVPFVALAFDAEAKATQWNLDKAHTEIGFSVRHLGISNVKGKFRDFDATIEADEKTGKLTALMATAQAETIDTGNPKRDGHLRSDDFFNATKHPVLALKAKSFQWKGKKFTAMVDVTIRGVTKTVKFEGALIGTQKVNFGDGDQIRAGYEAHATINRQDFGLKFNALAEGVSVVADNVEIEIQVEMSRKLGTS